MVTHVVQCMSFLHDWTKLGRNTSATDDAARGWCIEGDHGDAKSLGLRSSTLRSRMEALGIRRGVGV